MKFSFALYETLRRLLLLAVGVGFLGLVLVPEEETLQLSGAGAASETVETAAVEPVKQKTLI